MDWLKLVIDRFFGLVAGLLPGSAVLIVIGIHRPEWARYFRDANYLGYGTKVTLLLASAVVAGWTVLAIYNSLVNSIITAVNLTRKKPVVKESPELPPWRSEVWRTLMKKYIGDGAPPDLVFVTDESHQQMLKAAAAFPFPIQQQEIDRVNKLKSDADIADLQWAAWWHNLHWDVLYPKDPVTMILYAIEANMQAASMVLLLSMPATPVLYQWWIVAPCLYWIVLRISQGYRVSREGMDPWASFSQQIAYLRGLLPGGQAAKDA